ncbi:hypothetical protein EDB92DRAFT_1859467 [Lactarius akahatsu]|uniref:Uncharacterized protein n=1 Tax=Lactarius akahatsu TaxID=416441 RepID=A0AAD4Q892_9AGAM|nr:hypothetical protein EDB92DRAFT_1859467 [Lactarius akahatsu]
MPAVSLVSKYHVSLLFVTQFVTTSPVTHLVDKAIGLSKIHRLGSQEDLSRGHAQSHPTHIYLISCDPSTPSDDSHLVSPAAIIPHVKYSSLRIPNTSCTNI